MSKNQKNKVILTFKIDIISVPLFFLVFKREYALLTLLKITNVVVIYPD